MTDVSGGYTLKKFSEDSIKGTEDCWAKQIEQHSEDVLAVDFLRTVSWARGHMDYGSDGNEGYAYGIFAKGSQCADAIITIAYQKQGRKWLKMLGLDLCPELYLLLSSTDQEVNNAGYIRIQRVYGAAVRGTVELTGTHPSKTVKLYGRTGTLLAFLRGLAGYLQEAIPPQSGTVSIEGRWLVIRSR